VLVEPPYVMEPVITVADAVPLLFMVRVQVGLATSGVAPQDTTDAVTVADFVNDPKRPKTKPAMAMAAIRVIAIRMTVARTGLIALCLLRESRRSIVSLLERAGEWDASAVCQRE